ELVRLVMRGIKRIHGVAQRRVDPLLLDDIAEICATMGDDLHATRDRALLQIGFAGALRRAELVTIRCSDLARTLDGMTITILRSKTDPFGAGRKILIAAEIGSLRPV